jgi:beta-lactamase class A
MPGRRSHGPVRAVWPLLAAPIAALTLLTCACTSPGAPPGASPGTPLGASAPPGSSTAATSTPAAAPTQPAQAVAAPDTTAGAQLRWLLTAMAHLPLSDGQVHAHFDAALLDLVSPAALNQTLSAAAGARLLSVQVSELNTVVGMVSARGTVPDQLWLTVDRHGLISDLRISPAAGSPTPATWAGVDAALRSVAPRVHLLVADVTSGSCQPVHAIDPGVAAPIGAAFKLYVLDALGRAVASGAVRWNQLLTVTARLKSLPAGELQDEPDGTQVPVLDTAAAMMSLSDNTATDMLINLVGRAAVEAALTATGMASPALDRPLLTTREIFVLKLNQWPTLAERYLSADEPGRRALLASTVDQAPLPAVAATGSWVAPRDINSLEYFASANDLCRAYISLAALARRPGLAPIGQVLSLNDDSLALDPAQWKTTWFKGGSEPGVLTMAYLATTRTGRSYVVTALAENPSQPIDETTAIPAMLSAIKGAFTLAARA